MPAHRLATHPPCVLSLLKYENGDECLLTVQADPAIVETIGLILQRFLQFLLQKFQEFRHLAEDNCLLEASSGQLNFLIFLS